ncbi:hypothetical protein [Spirosoma fluviale]|uniref:Uncharacterized protein n=1 Tax=Spirosoma fluviale TaxID=1597977 RepID=A0A286G0P3_9BACT|nr:hypothetical protein [Spirosoma fluviale]SOD89085.1 hypothetical protein SAMN06269250_2945 [Spirosoma fluviale]
MEALSTYAPDIWLNDVKVNLPLLFDLEAAYTLSFSEPGSPKRNVLSVDHGKRLALVILYPADEFKKNVVLALATHWDLRRWEIPDNIGFAHDFNFENINYGASAYLLEDFMTDTDLLVCYSYTGDKGRTPMTGLIYKVSTVKADARLRAIFY